MSRCVDITRAIVSVKCEHGPNHDSPFDGSISRLKLEKCLKLECIISAAFLWIIFKIVLFGVLIISNVLPSELVDLCDL